MDSSSPHLKFKRKSILSVLTGSRLGMQDSSLLSRLKAEVAACLLQTAPGPPPAAIERLKSTSRELRLGGACVHGADVGPKCKYCGSSKRGPYVTKPPGLDVMNEEIRALRKLTKKEDSTLLRESDRIEMTLGEIDEDIKTLVARAEEEERRRRKRAMALEGDDARAKRRAGPPPPLPENSIKLIKQSLGIDDEALRKSHETLGAEKERATRRLNLTTLSLRVGDLQIEVTKKRREKKMDDEDDDDEFETWNEIIDAVRERVWACAGRRLHPDNARLGVFYRKSTRAFPNDVALSTIEETESQRFDFRPGNFSLRMRFAKGNDDEDDDELTARIDEEEEEEEGDTLFVSHAAMEECYAKIRKWTEKSADPITVEMLRIGGGDVATQQGRREIRVPTWWWWTVGVMPGSSAAEDLLISLSHCHALRKLGLRGCAFPTVKSCGVLKDALTSLHNLRELDVSTSASLLATSREDTRLAFWGAMVSCTPKLETLDVSGRAFMLPPNFLGTTTMTTPYPTANAEIASRCLDLFVSLGLAKRYRRLLSLKMNVCFKLREAKFVGGGGSGDEQNDDAQEAVKMSAVRGVAKLIETVGTHPFLKTFEFGGNLLPPGSMSSSSSSSEVSSWSSLVVNKLIFSETCPLSSLSLTLTSTLFPNELNEFVSLTHREDEARFHGFENRTPSPPWATMFFIPRSELDEKFLVDESLSGLGHHLSARSTSLTVNAALRVLNLSGCLIRDPGCIALARALDAGALPCLSTLSLERVGATAGGVEAVLGLRKHSARLERLVLNGNGRISSSATSQRSFLMMLDEFLTSRGAWGNDDDDGIPPLLDLELENQILLQKDDEVSELRPFTRDPRLGRLSFTHGVDVADGVAFATKLKATFFSRIRSLTEMLIRLDPPRSKLHFETVPGLRVDLLPSGGAIRVLVSTNSNM